jgi:parallel beta-helix repeat protein
MIVDSNENKISENNASNSRSKYGIFLFSADHNEICNNSAYNNHGGGIVLRTSYYNTIANNTAKKNWLLGGIYLVSSWYNTKITENKVTNNNYGIFLLASDNNGIYNNIVKDNYYEGIYIDSSSKNTITENDVRNNKYGVRLEDSIKNIIYDNNLVNNAFNANDDVTNQWDSGNIGNHYSNFDDPHEGCLDINRNNICDAKYQIPGGTNFDCFPRVRWP